ncbi:MAG: hypothetical protein WC389_20075 [Lutibacter sp.]|jgi:hypothetical protein
MDKFWPYIALYLAGIVTGAFLLLEMIKDKISNDQIEINRPKMKGNTDSRQEFTSNIPDALEGQEKEKKKLFNFKRKKK